MKNYKFGFTIAEMLVTLGIVAVIATIAMPQLNKEMQKKQAGPMLARAVQQIETGNLNIIQSANANGVFTDVLGNIALKDLEISDSTDTVISSLNDVIPHFWNVKSTNAVGTVKNFNGTVAGSIIKGRLSLARFYDFSKIPASIALSVVLTQNDIGVYKTGYDDDNLQTFVFIDTNTWAKAPNTFGKDIFVFSLMNNGRLKPYNSGNTGAEYTKTVVENGFKINYY